MQTHCPVTLEEAIACIEQKRKDDAPIATYEGQGVTKGKGRFGPLSNGMGGLSMYPNSMILITFLMKTLKN